MDVLNFYKEHSPYTNPRRSAFMLEGVLDRSVTELRQLVLDSTVDWHLRDKYPIQNERFLETNSRYADDILGSIRALEKGVTLAKVETGRPKDLCTVTNSSQYATLLLCLLRSKGVPSRKRIGYIKDEDIFGVIEYGDGPSGFVTHEIVEYYEDGAWKTIDPMGLERYELTPAVEIYKKYRKGEVNTREYKMAEEFGDELVIANLILDLGFITKHEVMEWDRYGWMQRPVDEFNMNTWRILDRIADQIEKDSFDVDALMAIYDGCEGVEVPEKVWCDSPVIPPHFELIRIVGD